MNDNDSRVTTDPAVCGGRPCVRGTRVRVVDVIDMLASGMAEGEIVNDYPYLTKQDIEACLNYVRRFADIPVLSANP